MDTTWPERGHQDRRTGRIGVDISQKIVWNLYAGGVAALTAVVAKKVLDRGWQTVTGHEPPDVNDPTTPPGEALAWALAVALGIGVTGVFMNRFAARRWEQFTGVPSPTRTVNLRL